MSKTSQTISTINLSGTKKGTIEIATIAEPYGAGSAAVASIGIFLGGSGDKPDWKVHIPQDNIADVIAALQKAQEAL